MKPAESFILNQPEPFKSMLLYLQVFIEGNFPEADLQFKWKIPFYYFGSRHIQLPQSPPNHSAHQGQHVPRTPIPTVLAMSAAANAGQWRGTEPRKRA